MREKMPDSDPMKKFDTKKDGKESFNRDEAVKLAGVMRKRQEVEASGSLIVNLKGPRGATASVKTAGLFSESKLNREVA